MKYFFSFGWTTWLRLSHCYSILSQYLRLQSILSVKRTPFYIILDDLFYVVSGNPDFSPKIPTDQNYQKHQRSNQKFRNRLTFEASQHFRTRVLSLPFQNCSFVKEVLTVQRHSHESVERFHGIPRSDSEADGFQRVGSKRQAERVRNVPKLRCVRKEMCVSKALELTGLKLELTQSLGLVLT